MVHFTKWRTDELRIAVMDRRNVAMHEAGHLIIGRFLDMPVTHSWIFPVRNPGPDDRTWGGSTRYCLATLQGKSAVERRMFAVAGSVAEVCWHRDGVDFEFWQDELAMSPTDWEMSGCVPGDVDNNLEQAIDRVGTLFDAETGRLWPELCRLAHHLITIPRVE